MLKSEPAINSAQRTHTPLSGVSYEILTYGCKVNAYDSGLLEQRFGAQAMDRSKTNPDVWILNTCAVTAEATKEAKRQVRRLKAKSPLSKVVVTGCAAQVDTEEFKDLPGVDLVVANSHKSKLEPLLEDLVKGQLKQKVYHSNIFKKEELEGGGGVESSRSRSFLKIQDGCNSFCTFCVIPFARGKSRSLSVSEITDRVNELYRGGIREVVLTGVHIGDYEDGSLQLPDLVQSVLRHTEMPRIRLSSLEPIELTPEVLDLFENSRLCPHFHISLQSPVSRTLKNMKRNYDRAKVEWALDKISQRWPDAFVGMDIIAGFPGESEDDFAESVEIMKERPWTRMHVFPYSPRGSTYALRMEGHMDRSKIMKRAAILRALSQERFRQHSAAQVGTTKSVLVLKDSTRGLSADYWNVDIRAFSGVQEGDIISVPIERCLWDQKPGWLKAGFE